jgi:pyridoxal 5'-phosphate synthase pdxT subunit
MRIGVLALQGDFAKHEQMLRSMEIEVKQVRRPEELETCEGLIIPGGESTVMMRQLDFIQMKPALCHFAQQKPVFGTCAGLILMASQIQSSPMKPLGMLDITVERNAFGRQIESFQASLTLQLEPDQDKRFQAYFIRAPRIRAQGAHVHILALYEGEAVLVQQGHHLGASFHPELTEDSAIHQYFIHLVQNRQKK